MISLCRLCATCTEATELITEMSELESKLAVCCGWKPSENEIQMPQKACDLCVDQLNKSWNFVEQIWAAEKQLNKLLSDQTQANFDKVRPQTVEVKLEDETKHNIISLDLETKNETIDDDVYDDGADVFGESISYSNDESHHSDEHQKEDSVQKNDEKKQMMNDPFLATVAAEDCLGGGLISANGVTQLQKLHPDMKTVSWNDMQYKCDTCNRVIKGPHNLYAHIRSIHIHEIMSIKLSCFYCNTKHRREFALNRHVAAEHFEHLKFRCPHCTDYYWDIRELNKHRNMHTDVEYKCELCEQVFFNRDLMYGHCSSQHTTKKQRSDPDEEYICDICSKRFKTKSGIKNHLFLHTGKFNYVCDQCGWKFQSKGNLKGHLATFHTTERPFKCEQCNKKFKTKHQLKNHSVIHNNIYKHACTVCGRKFRRPYTLNVHMRSHTHICPYTCRYCGKSFRHNITLQTHERAHTNDKPYACTHCEYRSTSKGNLNKHMMRAHSIDFRNH